MTVGADKVKELRDKTGAGFMDCKKALAEVQGDFEKAVEWLRKKGVAAAGKRRDKAANEGSIYGYIHPGGKVGVLVELKCETDFVARTADFTNLQKDIALQIAAMNPRFLAPADVPAEVVEKERAFVSEQAKQSGKPAAVIEKMVEGRLGKYYAEICLLEQPFVKDDKRKVNDLIVEMAGKLGENIQVSRFCRFELGADKQ